MAAKRIVIEPSALDKRAPKGITVMYRLCRPPQGRRPPDKICDTPSIENAQQVADDLSRQRIPFIYLTWWRDAEGNHVKKWSTLLRGKSRHFKLTVPFVDGVTDEMIKLLVQNAILHAAAKPKEYTEQSVHVRADPDLNRIEVDDEIVQVRVSPHAAAVLRSMPSAEATALVEMAITGDNAEPVAEVVSLNMVGGSTPGKHINPLRDLPVGTKLYAKEYLP